MIMSCFFFAILAPLRETIGELLRKVEFEFTTFYSSYNLKSEMKKILINILKVALAILLAIPATVSYAAGKNNSSTVEICTPRPTPQPRINGPLIYGCHPGNPFLYRIPCQGERPVRFSAKGLPKELNLDAWVSSPERLQRPENMS